MVRRTAALLVGDAGMALAGPLGIGSARDGSGTSWLPDLTPMHALHAKAGDWALMLHGNAFLQYINESGARGDSQLGSIHWIMGMAQRNVGGGPLSLRAMLSVEPFTVARCGYPNLIASGERCNGSPLHDRQHPHDFVMELAAVYQRPIAKNLRVATVRRPGRRAGDWSRGPSASRLGHAESDRAGRAPLARLHPHQLRRRDRRPLPASMEARGLRVHGREPDEERWDLDLGRLDSYSGRVWLLPTDRWAFQVSAAHLEAAEEHGGERIDVARVTASATYHRPIRSSGFSATTVAWGRNREGDGASQAVLAETAVSVTPQNTVFARAEVAQKTGEDLVLPNLHEDTFTVGKVQLGYARALGRFGPFVPGIGASTSLSVLPARLRGHYDGRANLGVTVFLSLRPADAGAANPVTLVP